MHFEIYVPILLVIFGAFCAWALIRFKDGTSEEKNQKALQAIEAQIKERYSTLEKELGQKKNELHGLMAQEKESLVQEKLKTKALKKELEERENSIVRRERLIQAQEKALKQKELDLQQQEHKTISTYETVAKMTQEEAKEALTQTLQKEVRDSIELFYKEERTLILREIEQKRDDALQAALENSPKYITKEYFTTELDLSDQYETRVPKLIGRDGRNIQTLERLLALHISFDDTRKQAYISSPNSEARWIAAYVLNELQKEDKITPSRIIEAINHAHTTLDSSDYLFKIKEELASQIPEALTLHPEIRKILNRLYLTQSLGQNLFYHSLEVATLMESMNQELQLPFKECRLIGLLHDIGKILDPSWGKSHTVRAASFLRKYRLSESIIVPIESHHSTEILLQQKECALLRIADRISGGALNSRKESSSETTLHHSKLLRLIEELFKKEPSVEKAWASYRKNEEHAHGAIEAIVALKNATPSLSSDKKRLQQLIERELEKRSLGNSISITFLEK